jgi:hypothetical protein
MSKARSTQRNRTLQYNIKNIQFYTNMEFANELDDCCQDYNLLGCDALISRGVFWDVAPFGLGVTIYQTTRNHSPENSS